MKFLFDIFPVVCFFAVYWAADLYAATAAAIAATGAQVLWLRLRRRRVEPMLWASLGIILVFGGLTLALEDPLFIKWKPTVLYWLFAAALAVSAAAFDRNLIRAVLAGELHLPERIWSRLNWSWVAFFALMGVANLYVAFPFAESWCAGEPSVETRARCATDLWVNFKLFGGIGLMLAFMLAQGLALARHLDGAAERKSEP